MRLSLTSLWWIFQHLGYLPHILQFKTLLQQESLGPEIIFMSDGSKQSKCYLFCTSAFLSAYTASHISYTFSLWMPGRLLFKQVTFLLPPPPPQKKKKGFHESGRRRKKIKLKQHNYISFSSILSTRWEGEPQRKPPLLLGWHQGREMPETATVAELETCQCEAPTLSKWDLNSTTCSV